MKLGKRALSKVAPTGMRVLGLISGMVERGVHPADDAGIAKVEGYDPSGERRLFDWQSLFELDNEGRVFWSRSEGTNATLRHAARKRLVYLFLEQTSDVLYGKTYFALEESGLGYPRRSELVVTERKSDIGARGRVICPHTCIDGRLPLHAQPILRVGNEDEPQIIDFGSAPSRVKSFAKAVWGEDAASAELEQALSELSDAGHPFGLIRTRRIAVRMVHKDDPYWRCSKCSRVHLHRGFGVCTRCHETLPEAPFGTVSELRRSNFLARRVLRCSVI